MPWVAWCAFEVIPDYVKMAASGVTIKQIKEAIDANNRNDGAGRLGEGDEVMLVRSEGSVLNLSDLQAIVVTMKDGVPIRLGNLAEVKLGTATRYGAVTKDGQSEAVQGLVLGLAGANAQKVVEGVRKKLAELQPTLPQGVTTKVFYDRASLVTKAVGAVSAALLEATVLVIVLLVLFLGNIRAALTVALVLPLAALMTFILMRFFGMSANLMSLGGLAIAIGMLVDAAVVVVENIVQRLATDPTAGKLPRLHTIYRAVREVAVPVTSGILIIITVFLPLLTLQGLEGKFFVPVALTIVFALAASLVLSLTVIPVMASYLLREVKHEEPWLPRKLLALYEPALAWGLVSLEQTAEIDIKIQRALMEAIPEIAGLVARAGSDEIGLDPMGLNQTDTYLLLKPQGQWRMKSKEALMDEVRKVLDPMPGIKYSFTQPIEMRVSEMIIGVRGDLAIKIFGPELSKLNDYASQVEAVLKTVNGNQDVYTVQNDGVQYLRVAVDRLQAGRLGLSVEEIQDALRTQIEGQRAGIVIEGNRRTPIVLRGSEAVRTSPAEFAAMRITTSDGNTVPLASVAAIPSLSAPKGRSRSTEKWVVVTAL